MLSVSSQRKYNFYHQNTLLDAFRTNSSNIIGRNPSMVIPLLANQDLTPMLNNRGLAFWRLNFNVYEFQSLSWDIRSMSELNGISGS